MSVRANHLFQRVIIISLSLLFVYSYLLYYAVACFQWAENKHEVNSFRSRQTCFDYKLVTFVFCKKINPERHAALNWKSQDEFVFQETLYDVIEKKETKDSLFFYCVADEIESEILFQLEKHIRLFTDHKEDNQEGSTLKFLLKDFLCHAIASYFTPYWIKQNKPKTFLSQALYKNTLSRETPPPEYFFCS